MILTNLKDSIWMLSRWLFYRRTKTLNPDEREGLRQAVRNIISHRLLLAGTLLSGLLAAVFEGGSLGILGLSVGVITGEISDYLAQFPGWAGEYLNSIRNQFGVEKTFVLLVGIAIGAQILKSILTFVSMATHIALSYAVLGKAQRNATDQIMSLPFSRVSMFPAGKLAMIVDEAGSASTLSNELCKAFRAFQMVVVYAGIMLFLSWKMTVLSFVIFGVIWVAITKLAIVLKKLSRTSVSKDLDTWKWTVEFLNSPRLIHIFNTAKRAAAIIDIARSQRIAADLKREFLIATIVPTFEMVTVLAAGLFLVFGYTLAGDRAIAVVPTLFVFILVFFRIKPQIKIITDIRVMLSDIVPRFEPVGHLFNVCDNSEEISKGTGLIEKVSYGIEFRDVYFSYPNTNRLTLEKLNIFLPKGKSVAFVGESGGGKSTIVNLLLGLYQPTSGTIFVDGHDLKTLNMFEWRCKLGVVDQEVFLLNSSVLDNIRFGREDFSLSDVDEAAGTSHAREFISRLEQGYDTVIGDRGYKLSGGQKQRIALARALLGNPEILIFDEATSALDSLSEKNIQQTIEKMRGSRTVITIAHRLGTIARADNVVVIEKGRVVEEGTKEELLAKGGRFHALSVA